MDVLNVRADDGVVHRALDVLLTDCLLPLQEGWTFVRAPINCIACLSTTDASRSFAHELTTRVSRLAAQRCYEHAVKTALRNGDTLHYKQTFTFNCIVSVADDGSIMLMDGE